MQIPGKMLGYEIIENSNYVLIFGSLKTLCALAPKMQPDSLRINLRAFWPTAPSTNELWEPRMTIRDTHMDTRSKEHTMTPTRVHGALVRAQ